MLCEGSCDDSRGVRLEDVVGVEEDDDVATERREARVQRRRLAAVFLDDQVDPVL